MANRSRLLGTTSRHPSYHTGVNGQNIKTSLDFSQISNQTEPPEPQLWVLLKVIQAIGGDMRVKIGWRVSKGGGERRSWPGREDNVHYSTRTHDPPWFFTPQKS